MWNYNQDEHPPAPFLDVVILHLENSAQSLPILAKIDTGADVSALPTTVITQLGLPVMSKMVVEGYNGVPATVSTYGAALEIRQARFRSQGFISTHEPFALLGRDILNYFYVLLNGPNLNLEMQLQPFQTA